LLLKGSGFETSPLQVQKVDVARMLKGDVTGRRSRLEVSGFRLRSLRKTSVVYNFNQVVLCSFKKNSHTHT